MRHATTARGLPILQTCGIASGVIWGGKFATVQSLALIKQPAHHQNINTPFLKPLALCSEVEKFIILKMTHKPMTNCARLTFSR